jgi:hypothetical protein
VASVPAQAALLDRMPFKEEVRGSNPIRGYTACRHRPAYGLPLSFFLEGLLPARARRSRADWTAETCHGAERW